MAKCDLTAARLRELLDYSPESGLFHWRVTRGRLAKAGQIAGSLHHGYIDIKIDGVLFGAGPLAWLWMTGHWPTKFVDHIDTSRSNNSWLNLRDVSNAMNVQNQRKANRANILGIMGVFQRKDGRFQSQLRVNGKNKHLGSFGTAEEASAEHLRMKRLHHPGCTL